MEKLIATIRSREISACLVLQTLSQLKAIYRDNCDTIVGNCDATLFLGGQEKTTLEELSKVLGKETFDIYTNSITKGQSPSYGQNYQKQGKDLMSLDELSVMDGGSCILRIRGIRPFLSAKYDLKNHQNYKLLSEYDKHNSFDLKKYLSTHLKVKPDDEYDVFEINMDDEEKGDIGLNGGMTNE